MCPLYLMVNSNCLFLGTTFCKWITNCWFLVWYSIPLTSQTRLITTSVADTLVTVRLLRLSVTVLVSAVLMSTNIFAQPSNVQSLIFGANHKSYDTGLVFSGNRNTSIFLSSASSCPRTRAHSSAADRTATSLNIISDNDNSDDF